MRSASLGIPVRRSISELVLKGTLAYKCQEVFRLGRFFCHCYFRTVKSGLTIRSSDVQLLKMTSGRIVHVRNSSSVAHGQIVSP